MKILIDLQGAQTESRFRGIGRYTMDFVRSLADNLGDHQLFIAINGGLADPSICIEEILKFNIPEENVLVWYPCKPLSLKEPVNYNRSKISELMRLRVFCEINPDIIHITSLFEGYVDDAAVSIGPEPYRPLTSAMLYDLIPLFNPAQYLDGNEAYRRFYLDRVASLKNADLLFAISECSKREAVEGLAFDGAKIETIYAGLSKIFENAGDSVCEMRAAKVLNKYGINHKYILYTGGADERKNLSNLVLAYANLPEVTRADYLIVFVGRMPGVIVDQLRMIAEDKGVCSNSLSFTGFVDDEELLVLYQRCDLFVFPSWHEGFGLPVLEAMSCGVPVIAANTSSLPEVIGNEDYLFDPYDFRSISGKMLQVLTDDDMRSSMRLHGLSRSKAFAWDDVAKKVIKTWEQYLLQSKKEKLVDLVNEQYEGIVPFLVDMPESALIQVADCIDKNEYRNQKKSII